MNVAILVLLAFVAIGLGRFFGGRRAASRASGELPIELVLLLRSPRTLATEHLVAAAKEAFGRDLTSPAPDASEFALSDGGFGMIRVDGYAFVCSSVPNPITPDPEGASMSMSELRIRTAFAEHRAHIVLMSSHRPEGTTRTDAYARLGQLAAALVDDTAMLVCCGEVNMGTLVNEATLKELRSGDPLAAMRTLNFDAIGLVSHEDPRMAEATAEARRRLPEFVAALQASRDTEPNLFLVKGPFTDGTRTEFMWVEAATVAGERIVGKLANDPFGVRGLRRGAQVEVSFADVSDWAYPAPHGMVGLFTEKIVSGAIEGAAR